MSKKLHPESEIYYDNTTHGNVFDLYWDNDIVRLTRLDCIYLRDLLDNWIMTH